MKLLVVDGNSILNRAFYGIRPLTTKDGMFTNAIYGFLTMLEKIKADTTPDRVAIAFDLKAKTFRHEAYALYKANRKGMPEELHMQLQPLKDLLSALGYKIVTCEGYEADDILGTLAKSCEKNGDECVIATGDRDSLQLVSDKVSVRLAKNLNGTMIYTPDTVLEEYGVTPKELIEIKAIQGDSSDNIPGVAGVGPKGATELIQKFKTVEYIYDHIDELDIKDNMRKKLIDSKENALISRMLGEICLSAPVDTNLDEYVVTSGDRALASKMMAKLELFSLIGKLGLDEVDDTFSEEKESQPLCVQVLEFDGESSLKEIKTHLKNSNKLCLYTYFEGEDVLTRTPTHTAYVLSEKVVVCDDTSLLCDILKDNKIEKLVFSSKELFSFADKQGFEIENLIFDISLAGYLLNPNASSYDLEKLCAQYDIVLPSVAEDKKEYAIVYAMTALCEKLSEKIDEFSQRSLLCDIEIPLANVLAKMENIGFMVDVDGIKRYGDDISAQVENLQQEIYTQIGYEFNINSPKQLAVALFEDLGLPAKKKTKSGYSTNADVLESLVNYHPVISMILQYRTLAKLKSTYCDSLIKVVREDGRIHSSFNQTETRTGRISSTEPNLQNIPVRTELGRELRRFFVAKDDCVLIDADYSQIELRVLAHISGDENMCKAFIDNDDIHSITASQVFDMPLSMVTPIMRSRAKAVNFGIVYGIGAFSLAKDIGVTNKEAANYIKSYLEHYSSIDMYMKNIIERAKVDGYVETTFGRRRYLPELSASNHMTRAFGERVARNAPIQGTAADIIKIAMVRVDKRLKEEGLCARLILQVHDELIVEAPAFESMRVAMILQEEMENAVKLNVPLVAEASVGKTWYDAKG
ncbi:MAG: DNA polymerase I [Ruminococcaceae bacterium]|nr:DNA polymerase I [Oscillospiraceae bacterium]